MDTIYSAGQRVRHLGTGRAGTVDSVNTSEQDYPYAGCPLYLVRLDGDGRAYPLPSSLIERVA